MFNTKSVVLTLFSVTKQSALSQTYLFKKTFSHIQTLDGQDL